MLLGVASGAFLPYGGIMPFGVGSGPYYGYGYPMSYHGGIHNGMSQFSGDGRHYGDMLSNGLMHHSLGSAGATSNGGGHGFTGGQRYADQQQGLGGYRSSGFGGNFNNGAGGYRRGNGFSDISGRGNAGGFNDAGHNKGHKTTGFHKSYHNVETGRDTKYVDEDHDSGARNFGQEFGNNFADAYGSGFRGAGANGQFGTNSHFDQAGQHGLAGGSFNGANFGGHGANNFYNGQDLSLRDSRMANDMNRFGQGYHGMGNHYGMGQAYMPHAW